MSDKLNLDFKNPLSYLQNLNNYIKEKDAPRIKLFLKFINNWLELPKEKKYKSLAGINLYTNKLPNDDKSKEYLIKYFKKYDKEFNLELEYNEELFNTDNMLYFIKLILKKMNYTLKLDKKNSRYYVVVYNKKK